MVFFFFLSDVFVFNFYFLSLKRFKCLIIYFLGVVAFVDYKVYNERCPSLGDSLINLGAKVEKTFNRKVSVMISYYTLNVFL